LDEIFKVVIFWSKIDALPILNCHMQSKQVWHGNTIWAGTK